MSYWKKIMEGFNYKSKGGAPDFTNPNHRLLLRQQLLSSGWNENAVNELLYNLTETKDETDDSWWTKMTPQQQKDYIKKHPKSQKAMDAEKEKDKKDKKQKSSKPTKELNDVDKDFYDRDVEPNDSEYQRRVEAGQVTNAGLKDESKRITRDTIAKHFPPGVPKKYIDTMVRLLNSNGNVNMTDVLDGSGAGKMPAQAAELFTMMAATMNDEQFNGLMSVINDHHNNLENPRERLFDKDWLESIAGARASIRDMAGDDDIEFGAWDLKDEVEAMGLDYNKKGFSTDVYFRTKSGKLIEVSLKKDTKVMFAQPSAGGHVEDKAFESLSKKSPKLVERARKNRKRIEELKLKKKDKTITKEEQQELGKLKDFNDRIRKVAMNELYGEDNPANPVRAQNEQEKSTDRMGRSITQDDVAELEGITDEEIDEMSGTQGMPTAGMDTATLKGVRQLTDEMKKAGYNVPPIKKKVYDNFMKNHGGDIMVPDKRGNMIPLKKLLGTGQKYYAKTLVMMNKMLARKGNKKAQERVDSHLQIGKDFEEAFLRETLNLNTPAGRAMYDSTMDMIAEKFPLKAMMEGEEAMALGGLRCDPEVLGEVFGVNPETNKPYTYDELSKKLKIKDGRLVLEIDGQEPVVVADFVVRNKGKGYNSLNSASFEMKLPDDMKRRLYCSNKKLAEKKGVSRDDFRKRLSEVEIKNQDKLKKTYGECK
tara:strand:+ start:4739 stop:6856 length:2118 start_codon:yes stop_codon:yes gene_type:complete